MALALTLVGTRVRVRPQEDVGWRKSKFGLTGFHHLRRLIDQVISGLAFVTEVPVGGSAQQKATFIASLYLF